MNNNQQRKVKKLLQTMLAASVVGIVLFTTSCKNGETYAEMKEREKNAIESFINSNIFVGHINRITEEQFNAQGCTTDVELNQFVEFSRDGIFMQIVRNGEGKTIREMAMERADSTAKTPILCKFLEYDIENADTTYTNIYTQSIVDKMQCIYSEYGRSFNGTRFTEGRMYSAYGDKVPDGWLKPLNYIRLSKEDGKQAKVRLIVPHGSGTTNASGYVLPFYYEISYQIPPNF